MEMEMTLRKAVVEYDPRNTTVVIWKLLEKWLEKAASMLRALNQRKKNHEQDQNR